MSDMHDAASRKLELGLRESNLALADDAIEEADRQLAIATRALDSLEVPNPGEVGLVLYAQARTAIATSIYTQVGVKMAVEQERAVLTHARAHMDEHDRGEAQEQQVRTALNTAMEQFVADMRAKGVDVTRIPGMPGFILGEPDDGRPDH